MHQHYTGTSNLTTGTGYMASGDGIKKKNPSSYAPLTPWTPTISITVLDNMPSIKVAIASNSLGKSAAGHTLIRKLDSAKLHGFDGVEVAIECLEAYASSFSQPSRASRLRAAAADIDRKAQELSLVLISLNPFGAYDGLIDPLEIQSRLEEAELWFDLCRLMKIPIFQVCTELGVLNLLHQCSANFGL